MLLASILRLPVLYTLARYELDARHRHPVLHLAAHRLALRDLFAIVPGAEPAFPLAVLAAGLLLHRGRREDAYDVRGVDGLIAEADKPRAVGLLMRS